MARRAVFAACNAVLGSGFLAIVSLDCFRLGNAGGFELGGGEVQAKRPLHGGKLDLTGSPTAANCRAECAPDGLTMRPQSRAADKTSDGRSGYKHGSD
jgi:hypothetical protein